MAVKSERGRSRRSIFSVKQRRGQKMSSIIQSDVPGSSVDKDMHYECIDKMETKKYLRKSYYCHIECFELTLWPHLCGEEP